MRFKPGLNMWTILGAAVVALLALMLFAYIVQVSYGG